MMGMFNKETFLSQQVNSEGSTQRLLVPEGVHEATITEVDITDGEKDGKVWAQMKVVYTFEGAEIKEALKRDSTKLTDRFFLQLTEMGALSEEEGDNVALNKIRRATDTNTAGFFPLLLVGKRLLVSVGVKNKKDSTDGELENVIRAVARIS